MSRMRNSPLTNAIGLALVADMVTAPKKNGIIPPMAEELDLIRRLPANTRGRDFVVGDLHGCYEMLMALLAKAGFDFENDRLFCTGDLADRGPDSVKCIRLLGEKWFFSVAGNHEEMLLRAAGDKDFDWQWWVANGGAWATAISPDELYELADMVAELPLVIVVGEGEERFNVLHAEWYASDAALEDALDGSNSGKSVPLCLTWGRELFEGTAQPDHEHLSLTFVGHTPVDQISRIGNMIYLETSAFKAHYWRDSENNPFAMTIVEPRTGMSMRSHG